MIAIGREPEAEELKDSAAFVTEQLNQHEAALKSNAPELALLDFCQVLLCLNEFVYID